MFYIWVFDPQFDIDGERIVVNSSDGRSSDAPSYPYKWFIIALNRLLGDY